MMISKKLYLFYKLMLCLNILLITYCLALTVSKQSLIVNYLGLASFIGRLYAIDCKDVEQTRRWLESRINNNEENIVVALLDNRSVENEFNQCVLDCFEKNIIRRGSHQIDKD